MTKGLILEPPLFDAVSGRQYNPKRTVASRGRRPMWNGLFHSPRLLMNGFLLNSIERRFKRSLNNP